MKLRNLTLLSALALAIFLAVTIPTPTSALAATTRLVANGGVDVGDCSVAPCATIQYAVDQSVPGDTISVAAGTYNEQVEITTSQLTIDGAGAGATIVKPASATANSSSIFSGSPIAAIFLVDGATGVTIQELTVDGQTAAPNSCSPTFVGVFYRAASGTLSDTHVTNIFNPAVAGCQGFLAVFVQSGNGGPNLNSNVTIIDNVIDKYGKNGITANEAGTSVTVTGNVIDGRGLTALGDAAQNGVQIAFGAHGKVTGNIIIDHYYTPPDWVACGILSIYGGGAIGQTKTNTFAGNEVNVCTAGNGPSSNSPFNP